ncbi:MAG: heparan-alpha-glucosaminide N-acetyltransferase domain-containing protein [Edaphobacter sp.]
MMITMPSQAAPQPTRVLSVDALRGITIAFMILVNDPGDWAHVYTQLDHAPWNGWTLTDLVFPSFLFVVGMSIIFSFQSRIAKSASGRLDNASGRLDNASGRLDQATRRNLALHLFRRAAIIFAIKMFISAYPHFHFAHIRIYGVLTRIALCYLCAGLICLCTRKILPLATIAAALLIGYWALMRFVPVPGFGVPTRDVPLLDQTGNLAAWLDRHISAFTLRTINMGRLYEITRDPEGLLSTLPSIATTLLGSITAVFMRSPGYTQSIKRNAFAIAGIVFVAAGELWNRTFPINKNLWTSSYVLLAAGISLLGLALFYWLVDMLRLQDNSRIAKAALWPWLVFGSNAITAFVLSELFVETMLWIKLHNAGKTITAWNWVYIHDFSHGHSTELTSIAFALTFVILCFLPNWFLWHKRLFLKI